MSFVMTIEKLLEACGIKKESAALALSKLSSPQADRPAEIDIDSAYRGLLCILTDTYRLSADSVKRCADLISKKYVAIGRAEKDLIKHYLDYRDVASLDTLCRLLSPAGADEGRIREFVDSFYKDRSKEALGAFTKNWQKAEKEADEQKKFDLLNGLHSRLLSYLSPDRTSLCEIFKYDEPLIRSELPERSASELEAFCRSDEKMPAKAARRLYGDFYTSLLERDLKDASDKDELESVMNLSHAAGTPFYRLRTEEYSLAVINIDQQMFDACGSKKDFLNLVLSLIEQTYRVLKNHRTLVVNIENIFTADRHNIKWELYSYIGIFAEHFIPTVEKRHFYKPEELALDKCEYLGIDVKDKKSLFKNYFAGKISKEELQGEFDVNVDKLILDFEKVWYGYSFSDCLAVVSPEDECQSELGSIKNNSHIVLIFNKYRHDDRRIPCPECASIRVSGNSFPEVGLRSWECKNDLCPSRSKSNRGKRYSARSNFMQRGFEENVDLISHEMLRRWRRDITLVPRRGEILEMAEKYFSFSGENVLVINNSFGAEYCGRDVSDISIAELSSADFSDSIFEDYFEGGAYVSRFLNQIEHKPIETDEGFSQAVLSGRGAMLAEGDSRVVLASIRDNVFSSAVTSPPYYNARLYSQWQNLYLYLSDMYEITKEIYRTMKPGALYLYNIGDICGNENTVVSSNMGNKRILLGAYTVYIFLKAGFELVENILWDKGEPQSNRQKNDGKFTPFYQKPMNVYEHMFIFKKPGAEPLINPEAASELDSMWRSSIVNFSPVIKINSKGENMLGHTAPFPPDIPDFVAKAFTKSEDDIILEPFAGSGTSLASATRNKRRSFGIELSHEYAELIRKICDVEDI